MDRSIRLWSTVPHRESFWEHRKRSEAAESADELVSTALARTSSWGAAWELLTDPDTSADAATRSAAMARFSARAQSAAQKLEMADRLRAERVWARRIRGEEQWPDAAAVLESLNQKSFPVGDPDACIEEAERILDEGPSADGAEMRALVLAQLAVDHLEASGNRYPVEESVLGLLVLGRAKCRVGYIADAVGVLQRTLELDHTPDDKQRLRWPPELREGYWSRSGRNPKLKLCDLCHQLHDEDFGDWENLHLELETLHDDCGRPCDDVWRRRIAELEREIAEIEADPDVQIWLREKR